MKSNIKIVTIMLLSAAVVWFGLYFGPDRSNKAEAKVFDTIFTYAGSMPAYLYDDDASSKPRKVVVNKNTTYMTVQKSEDDITSILDFYEAKYQPIEADKPFENELRSAESNDNLNVIYDFFDCAGSGQHFRVESEGRGFFGTFQFKDSKLKSGSPEFFEELRKIAETGNLGQIGTGRIVIAMKPDPAAQTTIINMWTGSDFNLNHFRTDTLGDIPGKDIENIPRYPGNVRRFSMEQENYRTIDSIVVYEGGGSIVSNILFYRSRMKAEGWRVDPEFKSAMRNKSNENMLFYTKNDRESTIQIRQDEETGKIITAVMGRRKI